MSINAGDLDQRIRIERLHNPDDGGGGQFESWLPVLTVWASVLPTGGKEALEAGALQGVDAWRVTIRWRPGLSSLRHRFQWRGQVLNIRSIADPDNRRERLVAFAESGVAQ